jgi:hypothetical protein
MIRRFGVPDTLSCCGGSLQAGLTRRATTDNVHGDRT